MSKHNAGMTLGLLISISFPATLLGDSVSVQGKGLKVGEQAPVSGVYFAMGFWAAEHKMTCPAARRGKEPKIAVYTTTLDENVLDLALAVDRLIAHDSALKWSFVSVSDKKGGSTSVKSPGYYSKDELAERLRELKESASGKGIKQLTIGITSAGLAKEREKVGLSNEHNVVVAFLDGDRRKSRRVKFAKSVHSSKLDAKMIESLLAEIQTIRGTR